MLTFTTARALPSSAVMYVCMCVRVCVCVCVCKKTNDSLKTHISPEDLHEPISSKFGTAGRLADLITLDNFLAIVLGVLIPRGVEFWHFAISRRSR